MTFPSIRIEGSILSGELLGRLDAADFPGQRPADFGFDSPLRLKDDILRAWTHSQNAWRMHNDRLDAPRASKSGVTETRHFMEGLLALLGYGALEHDPQPEMVGDKPFRLSHRLRSHSGFPVHIAGARESLDRKPETGPRVSPHAHVQEYLNLTEHLYALVTNGRLLRLLRDSTRLVKLSYVEFDLDRIFGEELFADFAILYRLLHATRLPRSPDTASESLLEAYHQDALESGARIRDGLSGAVKASILDLANGFLNHPLNGALRALADSPEFPAQLYPRLLRLVYRLLFLMVIEERDLVFPAGSNPRRRTIYNLHYSLARLRRLAEKRHLADPGHTDGWAALKSTFRLFDETGAGHPLGVEPLGGDLFDSAALGPLTQAYLDNDTLLRCLRNLAVFRDRESGQLIRANYKHLDVEEFGSVYQGLLEYEPVILTNEGRHTFAFAAGDERSRTGSHYTPEELVQPLLKHSLDHLIADALKKPAKGDQEKALLSLRVCDVACGSGHILLAAARRIGIALAVLRTGDDQPSPTAFREAVRDVIRHCIYGMDLNPLAVELCKVALWLEAHVPGQPISFLDHRIHCGNAIVGLARPEELKRGIPDEAFKTLSSDDKDIAAALRKQNKEERKGQQELPFGTGVTADLKAITDAYDAFEHVPEQGASDYYRRRAAYDRFRETPANQRLRILADLQVAQFYLPKTRDNRPCITTHDTFRRWLNEDNAPDGDQPMAAMCVASRKRFAHWFIEFWDVMHDGGFDLIIGNPPYLGGQALSGSYGHAFCEWVKWEYAPAGLSELVVYFLRRIYDILRDGGFMALITTNSIKDGDVRADGLGYLLGAQSSPQGNLVFVTNSTRWPGEANLYVSLFTLCKGSWDSRPRILDGAPVDYISAMFEDYADAGPAKPLLENEDRIFQGVISLGEGFLLTLDEAELMTANNPSLNEVVLPVINGQELNNRPSQTSDRRIINFFDWSLERASECGDAFARVCEHVKPVREKDNRALYRDRWWQYAEPRRKLNANLKKLDRCFVAAATTKHLNFSALPSKQVFLNTIYVLTSDRWQEYAVVQSTIHEVWARKYSGALETRLRYSPTDCFATFPFPCDSADKAILAAIGETYHEHRRALMSDLWIGLTDLYNLFHRPDLTPEHVSAERGEQATIGEEDGFNRILRLRELHIALDTAVLAAYGWNHQSDFGPELKLGHAFHSLDYLPENDRTRFTISPDARRDVLARLLKLNHQRAAAEQEKAAQPKLRVLKPAKKVQIKATPEQPVRKHSKGINFKRGAIAAYAVSRLAHRSQFGRTQMEKVLYLAQQGLGVNLELEFKREAAGPFDEEIHKLESLAVKQGWFVASPRPGTFGTAYDPGANIDERCSAAGRILGESMQRFDWILDQIAKMNTERAELWATVHAAWNDLMLSAKAGINDERIVQEVYSWHPSKARFDRDRIVQCIAWMRREGIEPRGVVFETRAKTDQQELQLGLDLFGRAQTQVDEKLPSLPGGKRKPAKEPAVYAVSLIISLLSEARTGLRMSELAEAFYLVANPDLMKRKAKAKDLKSVEGWAARWNEKVGPEWFLPTLQSIGHGNISADFSSNEDDPLLELLDGPREHAHADLAYDAWIALRIMRSGKEVILPPEQWKECSTIGRSLFATVT